VVKIIFLTGNIVIKQTSYISASEKYGITKNQYLQMNLRQSPLSEYHDFKEGISKLTRVVVWGLR
jgi:hypothetical protein